MLNPRIYRTGLIVAALAVIVFAFSLSNQPGSLGSSLSPVAFNGTQAYNAMRSWAIAYPNRSPGSFDDDALASEVASDFAADHLIVSTSTFNARTAQGTRALEAVTGTLPGLSSGTILIVAHRDAVGSPAEAELSGTAIMVQLASVLAGGGHNRTIMLASTSGSAGASGAEQLARTIPGPVDAVIALGDLAGTEVRQPIVVPWSDVPTFAPPLLRNTVASALSAQTSLSTSGVSLAGQLVHLALPLSLGEQAPFTALGQPAVLLSLSGERAPAADQPVAGPSRVTSMGLAVLQSIHALDAGQTVPAPSGYLLLDGKLVPMWAVRLLVLALILPVLIATIDGAARARRRGHAIARWVIWVLASAVPFLIAWLLILAIHAVGLMKVAPPGLVGAGVVPMRSAGIAIIVVVLCALVASLLVIRPLAIRVVGGEPYETRRVREPAGAGAGAALLIVLCVAALAVWLQNPFAALLIVPALHLWMWVADPDVQLRPMVILALLLIGLAPAALVVLYYAGALGLGPVDVLWNGTLLLAGDSVRASTVVLWSLLLGCAVSVLAIALRRARVKRPEDVPVTVRGPITYAGPGSLGGTKSALRVRR
jgi:hypothetical protein